MTANWRLDPRPCLVLSGENHGFWIRIAIRRPEAADPEICIRVGRPLHLDDSDVANANLKTSLERLDDLNTSVGGEHPPPPVTLIKSLFPGGIDFGSELNHRSISNQHDP